MKNKALLLYTNEITGVCRWDYGDRYYISKPTDKNAWDMMSSSHQVINDTSDPDTRDELIEGIKLLLSFQGETKKK
jgi:hypothetical protein